MRLHSTDMILNPFRSLLVTLYVPRIILSVVFPSSSKQLVVYVTDTKLYKKDKYGDPKS